MVQQYLPPALMLEQLRNERYRQAAQGMQQGLNQALQTYMNMEQLKQAAAEKKAERDERARQFNEMQKYRDAQLQSLQELRQGQLGVQQQQQALAEKKAGEARADVLRGQTLEDVQRMALGIAKGQKPITGVDTPTAKEFMQQGISRFGQKAQTVDEATGRLVALFQNLEQLETEQKERPEALALAEAARVKGIDLPYGELRGVMTQTLADREKAALDLDKRKAEASALKALESQRKAAARGGAGGRGRGAGKAQRPYMQEKALDIVGSNKREAQKEQGNLQRELTEAQKLLRDLRNPPTEFGMEPVIDEAGIKEVQQRIATLNEQIKEYGKTIRDYDVQANQILAGEVNPFTIRQMQAAQQADKVAPEQSIMTAEQLTDIQEQEQVDPAQAAADASKQQRIQQIEAQMTALAPQVTAGPGSEPAIKMNQLAAERDKLLGIFRPDPGVAEAYRREAREAVKQKVALSPQDAERLIASAPLATQRKLKAEAAKMQNAGMSREEIAAVLGLRRAEMLPLSRGRF